MDLYDRTVLYFSTKTLRKRMRSEKPEIPQDDLIEYHDVTYENRAGKQLAMDIYQPNVDDTTELPMVVNIHGGALIRGRKESSTGFCRMLAKKGYLVFSLSYRLVPDVRVYEQFDDVCAGMDCVGRKSVEFNVDYNRVYLTAESAGAYLALYCAAMSKSKVLQDAIGYPPSRLRFRAMGLISGMYYTTRNDEIGRFLARMYYGKDEPSKRMARFTNPEDPEIIYNIPPLYLITAKADFLERYTLDFAGELGNKGIEHKLRHMGSDPKLIHSFPVVRPDYPESERVIDEILAWFEEHTK